MADHNLTPWKMTAPPEAVAASAGRAYWSVAGCGTLDPALAGFVAPPVVVRAAPVVAPVVASVVAPVVASVVAPLRASVLDLTVDARRVTPAPPRAPRRRGGRS